MGNRAPEDLGVGHPWELNVAGVNRFAGDFFHTVDPVRIRAGNGVTLRCFHHQLKLEFEATARERPWPAALLPNLRTVFLGKI